MFFIYIFINHLIIKPGEFVYKREAIFILQKRHVTAIK